MINILNILSLIILLDSVLFAIPKISKYYLKFESSANNRQITISGNERSQQQYIINLIISLIIIIILVYILLNNTLLFTYVLKPLSIIFYLTLFYFYGKYVFEQVFKNKELVVVNEYKKRRYLIQFKLFVLVGLNVLRNNELALIVNDFFTNLVLAEILYLFYDLVYQSVIIILLLDSISWIVKDILILFNLEKIGNINTHKFLYQKMYELEYKNDIRWEIIGDMERNFHTVYQFIIYIISIFFTMIYMVVYLLALLIDKCLNWVATLINKFVNKNLFIFPRIVFIGMLIYYYISLNVNDYTSEGAKNIFEYVSTIFIIPLILDELKDYKNITTKSNNR